MLPPKKSHQQPSLAGNDVTALDATHLKTNSSKAEREESSGASFFEASKNVIPQLLRRSKKTSKVNKN